MASPTGLRRQGEGRVRVGVGVRLSVGFGVGVRASLADRPDNTGSQPACVPRAAVSVRVGLQPAVQGLQPGMQGVAAGLPSQVTRTCSLGSVHLVRVRVRVRFRVRVRVRVGVTNLG